MKKENEFICKECGLQFEYRILHKSNSTEYRKFNFCPICQADKAGIEYEERDRIREEREKERTRKFIEKLEKEINKREEDEDFKRRLKETAVLFLKAYAVHNDMSSPRALREELIEESLKAMDFIKELDYRLYEKKDIENKERIREIAVLLFKVENRGIIPGNQPLPGDLPPYCPPWVPYDNKLTKDSSYAEIIKEAIKQAIIEEENQWIIY